MKLYEVFYTDIGGYVKFKSLTPEALDIFLYGCEDMATKEYMQYVIDNFVYNLRSDVLTKVKQLEDLDAYNFLQSLYYGCLMLNPKLDLNAWIRISFKSIADPATLELGTGSEPFDEPDDDDEQLLYNMDEEEDIPKTELKKIPKAKYLSLRSHLEGVVIGQPQAIEIVATALKRAQVGMNDDNSPLGVFLFSGSSGIGKTLVAKELHNHLFGSDYEIVRIDCGNMQQKHDSQRLIGSANGYIGYDDGGLLTNKMLENPNTVVLLDEVEKAHPHLWNMFLNVFDEGFMIDNKGNKADFRNSIIIMTTNLGNDKVLSLLDGKSVGFGQNNKTELAKDRLEHIVGEEIKDYFKPELVNRIDEIVVFNHLSNDDLLKIAELELYKINEKLSSRKITLKWNSEVLDFMVKDASRLFKGARGLANVRRAVLENKIADTLLENNLTRGSILDLVINENKLKISVTKPKRNSKKKKVN